MGYERPQNVSVIEPIGPAIEHVKLMLFRPFDMSKWFTVGFCAWLAYLGKQGGGNFGFRFGGRGGQVRSYSPHLSDIGGAIANKLPWILLIGTIVIPIIIVLWLVVCWLKSRGQFMFLHCVAGNKSEVVVPWKKYADQGNSLFLFRIVFGLIALAAIGIPIALGTITFFTLGSAGMGVGAVSGLIIAVFSAIVAGILVALVAKLTEAFVVPIMFLHTSSCLASWRELLGLLKTNKARIALYLLFQIAISIVIGFLVLAICLVGCCFCCASVLLLVPYVGTVILLPIFVFGRAYSLFYLRQFGPMFDVFGVQPA